MTSDFHYMIFMAKQIHNGYIIVISHFEIIYQTKSSCLVYFAFVVYPKLSNDLKNDQMEVRRETKP